MKTLTLLVIVGAIAVLIVSGALSLQFHADKLSGIAAWATDQASSFSVSEQIRDKAISIERQGQDTLMPNTAKSADTSLARAKADSDHFSTVANKTTNLAILTPAANLLLTDLDKLATATKDVTVDHLNQIKPAISDIFAQTSVNLAVLQSQNINVSDLSNHLTATTNTIESYIGPLSTPAPLEPPPP